MPNLLSSKLTIDDAVGAAALVIVTLTFALLSACGGGDPVDNDRATIDPPKCETGVCK